MNKSRRSFLKAFTLGAPALALSPWANPLRSAPRPNILFIMSDDHARQALSAYGSPYIRTPNIDRIGREGVRFASAFVTNSICAPSRATILTGKYSHINGLRDNQDQFNPNQFTFPEALHRAGYQTFFIGKWHLKTDPVGFDYWKILPGQGQYYHPDFRSPAGAERVTGYVTDRVTDFAIQALEQRERNRPFLMLLHHKAPHRNWMPPLKYLPAFLQKEYPLPENFFDDYATRCKAAREADMRVAGLYLSFDMKLKKHDYLTETGTGGRSTFDAEKAWEAVYARFTPEERKIWDGFFDAVGERFRKENPQGKELAVWKYQRYLQDYLACVASLDENIGRILDYLDQTGLAENTMVIYTSDQGFFLGEHGWYDKRFMYEESLGMPLMIRHPATIPPGQMRHELVLNLDFAPTILDYCGVPIPADLQGRSLRPLLEGHRPPDWRKETYYHYYEYPHGWHRVRRHFGIRTERFKLIHFYGKDIDCWELYDLHSDPREMNNLYERKAYREMVQELKARLRNLQRKVGDKEAMKLW
ncbi:MAG TPA: DUF4976 domain-containing protein [Bacteroidetes bacterium]|nr:DUF4976 domain-containing protein [Bacteroidota bacterium]